MKIVKCLKSLIIISMSFLMLLVGTAFLNPVSADNQESNQPYVVIIDGATYEFEKEEHYLIHMEMQAKNGGISTRDGTGYSSVVTRVSTIAVPFQFLNYHKLTPAWIKADSYSVSRSQTFSTSLSYSRGGFSYTGSYSFSQGVTVNIPSDASRFSRLGVYGDLSLRRSKVDYYLYGIYQHTSYINVAVVTDHYLQPVYK